MSRGAGRAAPLADGAHRRSSGLPDRAAPITARVPSSITGSQAPSLWADAQALTVWQAVRAPRGSYDRGSGTTARAALPPWSSLGLAAQRLQAPRQQTWRCASLLPCTASLATGRNLDPCRMLISDDAVCVSATVPSPTPDKCDAMSIENGSDQSVGVAPGTATVSRMADAALPRSRR